MKQLLSIVLVSLAFAASAIAVDARDVPPPVPQMCRTRDCTPLPPVSQSPARNREYRLVCKHPGFRYPICQLVVAAPPTLPQH